MRRFSDCPEKYLFPKAGDVAPGRTWEQPQVSTVYEREETHSSPLYAEVQEEGRDTVTNVVSSLEYAYAMQSCHPVGEGAFSSTNQQHRVLVPPMQARTASHTALSLGSPQGSDEGPRLHSMSAAATNATNFGYQSGSALPPGTHASAAEQMGSALPDAGYIFHEGREVSHLTNTPDIAGVHNMSAATTNATNFGYQSGSALPPGTHASAAEQMGSALPDAGYIFHEGREASHLTNTPDIATVPFMQLGASSYSTSDVKSYRGSNEAPTLRALLTRLHRPSVLGHQSGHALLPNKHPSASEQVEPTHSLQAKQRESKSHVWQHFFMDGTEEFVAVCKLCNGKVKLVREGDNKGLGTYPLRRHLLIFHSDLASRKPALREAALGAGAQLQLRAEQMEH